MKIVKVIIGKETTFFVVIDVAKLYHKLALQGSSPDSVEVLEGNVVLNTFSNTSTDNFLSNCCYEFNVTLDEIKRRGRTKRIVNIRSIVCYSLRQHFNLSYPEIGFILNRDHTSVMSLVKKVESNYSQYESMINRVEAYLS